MKRYIKSSTDIEQSIEELVYNKFRSAGIEYAIEQVSVEPFGADYDDEDFKEYHVKVTLLPEYRRPGRPYEETIGRYMWLEKHKIDIMVEDVKTWIDEEIDLVRWGGVRKYDKSGRWLNEDEFDSPDTNSDPYYIGD